MAALSGSDVCFEASDLHIGSAAQLIGQRLKLLLEGATIEHFEDLFAEGDGACQSLLTVDLLQAFGDFRNDGCHARLESIGNVWLQLLEHLELVVDHLHELMLVAQLANIIQADLHEGLCDDLQRVEALSRLIDGLLKQGLVPSIERLHTTHFSDQLIGLKGQPLSELLKVDCECHFLVH